jgi:ribosomal protein S18 acetylase RimI-like enzyme
MGITEDTLTYASLAAFGLAAGAEVLQRGFSDYFVPITVSLDGLLQSARVDSVDLAASRVIRQGDAGVGVALIARRGWTSRLAGMSIVPEARRQGVGRQAMAKLLAEARERGDRRMVFEVIEQNAPAVRLYEACGFYRVRRLVGHLGKGAGDPAAAVRLEEGDLREMGAVITANRSLDVPWQLSGETVAQLNPPSVAYRLDGVWIALANVTAPQVAIRAVACESRGPEAGRMATLLRAVMAKFPGREWRMSALWPEDWSEGFALAGLARSSLSQWQMARPLE